MKQNPRLVCPDCGLHYLRCECAIKALDDKFSEHLTAFFVGLTDQDRKFLKMLRIQS